MADDPQDTNQGSPQPPQQAPAPQPMPQAPAPPPNAQQIIAAQRAAIREQIAQAQQRDRAMFGQASSAPPAPPAGSGVFAQGAQSQQAQQTQELPAPPQGLNLPPGMTAEQIAQGIMRPQQMQQPQRQQGFAQQSQQKDPDKVKVLWHPSRNSQLTIELSDAFLANLPDSIEQETDPQAKVIAVLLSEILSLRSRVEQLEQGGGGAGSSSMSMDELVSRVYRLEATLFEQTQSLKQGAKALREEEERKAQLELEKKKRESSEEESE